MMDSTQTIADINFDLFQIFTREKNFAQIFYLNCQ